MTQFSLSNLSLSNILTTTQADTIAPFSASNLFVITNTSSLPTKGQPLGIGFFRGLSLIAATAEPVINCIPSTATVLTSAVSTWSVFTQTNSSLRPVYNATGGGTQGNKPYVAFNTTATLNNFTGVTLNCGTNGGMTIIMFVRFTSIVTGRLFQIEGYASGAPQGQGYVAMDQSGTSIFFTSTTQPSYTPVWQSQTVTSSVASSTEWAVRVLRYTNLTATSCKCEFIKFINPTTNPITTNAQYTTFTNTSTRFNDNVLDQNYLGGVGRSGFANCPCHVHAFKVWPSSLSDTDLKTEVNTLLA
jgi:hypothetical protein